ncbi:MAG: YCF48-related protein [Bacteroidota bacterium]
MRSFLLIFLLGLVLSFYSCGERLTPSFQVVELNTQGPIRGAYFFDEAHGIVAGGERFSETILQSTQDGGETWRPIAFEPVFNQTLFDIDFWDEQRGLACGIGGKYLFTKDGGATWRVIQSQFWRQMQGIAFASANNVFAVGGTGYSFGIMERSLNGGQNWALADTFDFELRDIVFIDAAIGFACGYGVILKTDNGGDTWSFTEARREFFSALCFPTPQIGYAVGRTGTIMKTTDQGETWERLRNGNLATNPAHRYHDVSFIDAENGYIVGDKGIVMRTQDGGQSWQKIKLESKTDWWQVQMLAVGKSVLCGSEGKILWLDE